MPTSDVRPDQWVRILPTSFSSFDVLSVDVPPTEKKLPFSQPPGRQALLIDRKTLPVRPFFARGASILCTELVLEVLESMGAGGWSATPVNHPSPNPVRGVQLYDLDLPGRFGAVMSKLSIFDKAVAKKPLPFGIAGAPVPPVVLNGNQWTGDVLCLTDWLAADTRAPYRALIARADFVQTLVKRYKDEGALLCQSVEVTELASRNPPARPPGSWVRGEKQWPRPTAWKGSVRDRIVSTAAHYQHFIPPSPPRTELDAAIASLESRYRGRFSPALREFLAFSNGASLFAGMLTFFPIGPRKDANPIFEYTATDDLLGANARVSPDDWRVTRADDSILFAARYGEFHAPWGIDPEGRVRLLPQTGEVLGPALDFEPWLADQVADLEWAWDHPEALGRRRAAWLDLPEE